MSAARCSTSSIIGVGFGIAVAVGFDIDPDSDTDSESACLLNRVNHRLWRCDSHRLFCIHPCSKDS
jgi:hypothetical protein